MSDKTWNTIEGKWRQLTGEVRETWGELTEDDCARIDGKRDKLVGKLQELYGWDDDTAEAQVERFSARIWRARNDGAPAVHR